MKIRKFSRNFPRSGKFKPAEFVNGPIREIALGDRESLSPRNLVLAKVYTNNKVCFFDSQSVPSVQEGMGQKICARRQQKILSDTDSQRMSGQNRDFQIPLPRLSGVVRMPQKKNLTPSTDVRNFYSCLRHSKPQLAKRFVTRLGGY